MTRRVELACDQARCEASIRRQHLVRTDHRETIAQRNDDLGVDPGKFPGQHQMPGDWGETASVGGVVPVNAEQVARIGGIRVDAGEGIVVVPGERLRVGQFRQARQPNMVLVEPGDRSVVIGLVDDSTFQPDEHD